jgi:hypothetical protein
VLHVGRHDVDDVAADPEPARLELVVVAVVDVVDQALEEDVSPELAPLRIWIISSVKSLGEPRP